MKKYKKFLDRIVDNFGWIMIGICVLIIFWFFLKAKGIV